LMALGTSRGGRGRQVGRGVAAAQEPADGEVQPCADEQERCQGAEGAEGAEGGEAPEHGGDSLPDDVPDRGVDQERAEVTEAPATTSPVRPQEPDVALAADLSTYLDKAYENKTLEEVLAAPVSALAGVTDADGELLQKAFNIKTVIPRRRRALDHCVIPTWSSWLAPSHRAGGEVGVPGSRCRL